MSLHALAWIALFLLFAGLTFRRSSWGIPLYLMTFYANPRLWWWGEGALTAIGNRWSLVAAAIFAAGVCLDKRRKTWSVSPPARPVLLLLVLYAVNATIVHLLLAVDPQESLKWLDLLWKGVGLLFLMLLAVRDDFDFKILLYAVLLGGTFICCEYYFFGAGHFSKGRLENLGLPAGNSSNFYAPLLSLSAILGGFLVFFGKRHERLLGLFCCVLLSETILQCVSRGAFLALLVGGAWLVVTAKGRARSYAVAAILASACGAFAVMGEMHQEKVISRFSTSFASEEERDGAAQSRIDRWQAALAMIADRPIGSGGNAFKSKLGWSYFDVPGYDESGRYAAQNGYLNMAAGWGVQALALYLAAIFLAWRSVRHGMSFSLRRGNLRALFLGSCIETALVVQLVATVFISDLRAEWYFWWIAIALTYERVFAPAAEEVSESEAVDVRREYVLDEREVVGSPA